jgi:hypothetical protein
MQTRIEKTTTIEGEVKFTPQWRKSWYSKWRGFDIYEGSNEEIVSSYPSEYYSSRVQKLEMAKEVIDNFLKDPVTEDKIEYIKYP